MVILMRTFLTLALQVFPSHGVTGDIVKEAHADVPAPETLDDKSCHGVVMSSAAQPHMERPTYCADRWRSASVPRY